MDDGDDTRVKDTLPTTTIEQLRAWFSLPSFEDLEEAGAGAAPRPLSVEQERQAEIEKVLEHVSPTLFARLEERAAGRRRLGLTTLEKRPWETPDDMISVEDTRAPTEDAWREVEIPMELRADLKQCTPQAFLRDLYRPESEFWIRMQPAFDDELEPVRMDELAALRALILADYRVGIDLTPATEKIRADYAARRAVMKRPWHEAKREEARQREAELLRKEGEEPAVPRSPEGPR
jgi:hypothetical protein